MSRAGRRTMARLQGLAALAVLTALVIGSPVLLYKAGGSPVPHHIPTWHQAITELTRKDNGSLTVFLAVVRYAGWVAWAVFAATALAETYAAIRGRQARRLAGPAGSMQHAIGRLVALAALTFTTPATVALAAATQPAPVTATAPALSHAGASLDALQAPSIRTYPTVTVRPGQCLWTIAEHHLGDGDRYPEIAALNYGRQMPDGQTFTDAAVIRPGWVLRLPPSATASAAATPHGPARHTAHTAAGHFGRPHHAARPADQATSPPTAASRPATAITMPAQAPAADTGSGPVAAGPAGHVQQPVSPVAVFGAGMLAGGAVALVGVRRHRQRQNRRPGRRIPLPSSAAAIRAEQRLRARKPPEHLQPLTLRSAIARLGQSRGPLPGVVALHVTSELLEVLLDQPAAGPPPAPFTVAPGRQGQRWQLSLAGGALGPGQPGEHGDLLPGLVTAGLTDHDGWLLLNLEALQVTVCQGAPQVVSDVLATLATELATSQLAGWYDLILAGFPELDSLACDMAGGRAIRQSCQDLEEAIDLLEARAGRLDELIAGEDPGDLRMRRYTEPDGWDLALLVSGIPPTARQLARITAATSRGCAAALVAAAGTATTGHDRPGPGYGDQDTRTAVADPAWPGNPLDAPGEAAAARFRLARDPAGGVTGQVYLPGTAWPAFTVHPQPLAEGEYQALASLFATASEAGDVDPGAPPYDRHAAPSWLPGGGEPGTVPAWPDTPPPSWPAPDTESFALGALGDGAVDAFDVLDIFDGAAEPGSFPPAAPALPDRARVQHTGRAGPRPGPLHIGVLGPLLVAGSAKPLHPGQAEMVVALALSGPAGLSNSALRTRLGSDPDVPKGGDALRQLIARTRHQLDKAPDGGDWIQHTGGGQYRLHELATFDWAQFSDLATPGMRQDDLAGLRAALDLIRGEPFAGCEWWWLDTALIESVRALITDTAHRLSALELSAGNPGAALSAALKGLEADPAAEQLHRAAMLAEDASGNLAGVRSAWKTMLAAIREIAADGEPHPDTVDLYRQLTEPASARRPARARA